MTRAKRITSRKNAWFRRFRAAVEEHDDEIALEGPKPVHDAIRLGWRPIAIAVSGASLPSLQEVPLLEFDPALFRQISDTVTSQGVIALFARREAELDSLFSKSGGVVVVIDGVQDPGNVGTVIRLAAAFDASGVVLTEGSSDPFGPKAIRASVGSVLAVPITRTTRRQLIRMIEDREYQLWAAAAGGEHADIPLGRVAIVFGSEGHGISRELASRAKTVSIPMTDRVESLNVSAAAAILLSRLYDARRRGTLSARRSRK